jgi:hypothetical protein
MSVNVIPAPQQSTWWQRLTHSEPKTVVREVSTTEISSTPGGSFDLKTGLRNGAIGAAVAGVLGGVSLLGKVALPIIGKVASVGGLARLAGVGGAIGLATAALPVIVPSINRSPAAKAALTGAAIGAAAGAILPLIPIPIGAAIGAGVGLLIHNRRNRQYDYPTYPGYEAYPGYAPYGTSPGAPVPNGLVPVTPNYGMYAGTAMNPYGNPMGYAGAQMGYGMPMGYGVPAGYGAGMMLPAQAQGAVPAVQPVAQPQVQAASAQPTPAPTAAPARPTATKAPKFKNAKTFTDKAGNLRQIGTGRILRPAAGGVTGVGSVPAGAAAPIGLGAVAPQPGLGMAAPLGAVPTGVATSLPYAGAAGLGSALPQALDASILGPAAIPARPIG